MAYSMVHLEIAYRLLDKFDWIRKPGDFLLGALAPDSVHFIENYHYHLKERMWKVRIISMEKKHMRVTNGCFKTAIIVRKSWQFWKVQPYME